MNKAVSLAWVVLTVSAVYAAPTPVPNFYTDAPTKKPAADEEDKPKATPKPKPTPKPASRVTATTATEKQDRPARAKASPAANKTSTGAKDGRTTAQKDVVATARPKPTATPSTSKSTAVSTAKPKPAARDSPPAPAVAKVPRKYPLDTYGLAAAFASRFDLFSFNVSSAEADAFREQALRKRLDRLAKAYNDFADLLFRRQVNARRAATAAYLLQQARSAEPPYLVPETTFAHVAAVRVALREDTAAAQQAMDTYVPLRDALNEAAEEYRSRGNRAAESLKEEPRWWPSHVPQVQKDSTEARYAVTVSNADAARLQTFSLLGEQVPPVEALKATLAAEALERELAGRMTLHSFTPDAPAPDLQIGTFYVDPDTPIPEMTGTGRRTASEPPVMKRPVPLGVRVEAARNAEVKAVADGVVGFAGPFRGYGNLVLVEHPNTIFSVYANLGSIEVQEGNPVKAGQAVGRAGMLEGGVSGIYFEVRRGKEPLPAGELLGGAEVAQKLFGM